MDSEISEDAVLVRLRGWVRRRLLLPRHLLVEVIVRDVGCGPGGAARGHGDIGGGAGVEVVCKMRDINGGSGAGMHWRGRGLGGGPRAGWAGGWGSLPNRLGRLLSVTNAVEAGTWRQGDSGWA